MVKKTIISIIIGIFLTLFILFTFHKIELLTDNSSDFEDRISTLESNETDIESRIDSLESEKDDLESRINELEFDR